MQAVMMLMAGQAVPHWRGDETHLQGEPEVSVLGFLNAQLLSWSGPCWKTEAPMRICNLCPIGPVNPMPRPGILPPRV